MSSGSSSNSGKIKCFVGLGIVLVVLTASLITISFGYVEYYEYAFAKQKTTGKVYTDKAYAGGRHLIGPTFTFKKYPANGQTVHIKGLTTFTSDSLIVHIDVFFVYFLRKNHLKQLHQEYQLNYHSVIINKAYDAIKNAAGEFSTLQFIMNRTLVEKEMAKFTRRRIGGNCCDEFNKDATCVPMEKCESFDDIGLMSTVRYFYLTKLEMPDRVERRYLQEMILVQEVQEESLKLQEAIVKKETDEMVKRIENRASELSGQAQAKSTLILTEAEANATKLVGLTHSKGLKEIMTKIGFSKPGEKVSYVYLKSLAESAKVNMAVDFNNYVIGGR